MNDKIVKYSHINGENYEMTFVRKNGQLMVNATQMAKPFGKKVNDFLRSKQTKEFISALESRYGNSRNGDFRAYEVIQGGNNQKRQGTWMDETLALDFAAWLSPTFKLWIYDHIQELIKEGETKIERGTPQPLEMHLDTQHQKDNVKAVNGGIWLENQNKTELERKLTFSNYHGYVFKTITGITPRQAKGLAKKLGHKSVIYNSARQVARVLLPKEACVLSVLDNINKITGAFDKESIDKNIDIALSSAPFFEKLLSNGFTPSELSNEKKNKDNI